MLNMTREITQELIQTVQNTTVSSGYPLSDYVGEIPLVHAIVLAMGSDPEDLLSNEQIARIVAEAFDKAVKSVLLMNGIHSNEELVERMSHE